MNTCKIIVLTITLLSLSARSAIYEARNSDDVDFFMTHNPQENSALLFYDPNEEASFETGKNIEKVSGVFKNIGEEGRTQESWVDQLNDKVHLMRIDVTKLENSQVVNDFRVNQTPLLILFDQGDVQLMEVISGKTFEHVKDIYQQKINERFGGGESGEVSDREIQVAQKAADDAKKAAADALEALAQAKQALKDHIEKQDQQNQEQNNEQSQNSSQKCAEGSRKEGSTPAVENLLSGVPAGYQLEYMPVLTKVSR
ncbi:unnamed protein product [Moneuplotes crassus]|uniref:Thioredoxin domain-containing protein n=1 Tax=Euplotes crassus TaxID=5936 RepID=A0AAD1XT51_EUPCR|nr:unnamed protein product [Moneuplotes crassus]